MFDFDVCTGPGPQDKRPSQKAEAGPRIPTLPKPGEKTGAVEPRGKEESGSER